MVAAAAVVAGASHESVMAGDIGDVAGKRIAKGHLDAARSRTFADMGAGGTTEARKRA